MQTTGYSACCQPCLARSGSARLVAAEQQFQSCFIPGCTNGSAWTRHPGPCAPPCLAEIQVTGGNEASVWTLPALPLGSGGVVCWLQAGESFSPRALRGSRLARRQWPRAAGSMSSSRRRLPSRVHPQRNSLTMPCRARTSSSVRPARSNRVRILRTITGRFSIIIVETDTLRPKQQGHTVPPVNGLLRRLSRQRPGKRQVPPVRIGVPSRHRADADRQSLPARWHGQSPHARTPSAPDAAASARGIQTRRLRGPTRRSPVKPVLSVARAAVPMFSTSQGLTRTTISAGSTVARRVESVPATPHAAYQCSAGLTWCGRYRDSPCRSCQVHRWLPEPAPVWPRQQAWQPWSRHLPSP